MTPSAPLPPAVSRPTRTEWARWQVFEGTLSAGDLEESGRRFDDYEINLRDGERALIALDTGDFDPVLNVYPAGQRGGSSAMSDDDGGGNLNAFMVLAPERGGTFIVRVTAFSEQSDGAYKLRVATERVPEREEATAAEAIDAAAEAAEAAEEHAH